MADNSSFTTEAFHERIQFGSEEMQDMQKKTFTKWINSHLSKAGKSEVVDLFGDFCDGKSLLALLEALSGSPLAPEKGKMRVHYLSNVSKAVRYLTDKCNIRLVNICSDDIVNGSGKLILGLVWSIILHWQVNRAMASVRLLSSSGQEGFEKFLLEWCRASTQGYKKVNIQNFTTSWSDGFAFNALINSRMPELFDYEKLCQDETTESLLSHAFQVAEDKFNIARLLDPEDMIQPDKKSVLIYLTCLYEAFSAPPSVSANQNTSVSSSPVKPVNAQMSYSSPASNLDSTSAALTDTRDNLPHTQNSTSTNTYLSQQPSQNGQELEAVQFPLQASSAPNVTNQSNNLELIYTHDNQSDITSVTSASGLSSLTNHASFTAALEPTRTWLHSAKDKFNKMDAISEDVETVKDQFQQHEKLMVELTQYQENVGNLINKGNTLLLAGDLNAEQEKEVRNQIELLNQEWEELRVGAMVRQTSLQQSLMELQINQLKDLESWLTHMEAEIKSFNCEVDNLENIQRCVEKHQELQNSLTRQEDQVVSLQNMVVIVEDGVQDTIRESIPAYQSMEKMLEELSNRWSVICQWITNKWELLQDVDVKWRLYHSKADLFNQWLSAQEVVLQQMKSSDISDPAVLLNQVQRLKAIETELSAQMNKYDELNDVGQALVSYLPSFPHTAQKIRQTLETYKQRWDTVVQMMEQQSSLIAQSSVSSNYIMADVTEQSAVEEFEQLETKISLWIDKSESAYELLETDDNETSGLTLEEQLVLLNDRQEEAVDIQNNVDRLQILCKEYNVDLGERNVKLALDLTEKWVTVNSRLKDLAKTVKDKVQHKQAVSELSALKDLLVGYKNWASCSLDVTNLDATEIGRRNEQCRVKVKAIHQQQERVDKLYKMRDVGLIAEDKELKLGIVDFHDDWQRVVEQIETKMHSLTQQLIQSPPKKYLDATDALVRWLSEVEDVLSEKVYISDINTMEKKISLYKDLQKAIAEHVSDVEYVNKTGNEFVRNSTTTSLDTTSPLKVQLTSLNTRWMHVSDNIKEKLSFLTVGVEKLQVFESQVNGLTKWMGDMEHFLEVEQPVVGDVETLQAQIDQSDGALADIETLQAIVDEINHTSETLVAGSEEEFGAQLTNEMDKMNERWTEIKGMAVSQNKLLKNALVNSCNLIDNITSLNTFLTEFDSEVSEKLEFTTKSDLDTSCQKVKRLEENLEAKRSQLQLIQTVSADLMERSRQDSLPKLMSRLKHIDHKWKFVADRLAAKQVECSDISTRYSDFLSFVQSEKAYLNQLQKKLTTGDNQAVDAEDMAAEMGDLESLLENWDNLSCEALHDLCEWFKQMDILTEETSSVKSELDVQYNELTQKARERVALLDRTSQKSQDTELRLSQMEIWMNEVNALFRDWNDQDLLAGDLPEDFATLKEEFSDKDAFLESISVQISDFKSLNKILAAERLERKLELITEDYSICQQNFLKWQRPVDFDPKLRRAQQQLHEIDDKVYLIEIYSEDPEHVGARLQQCAKFYSMMSEIKTEVEYVIKTGRQLVEKKQVDFPRRVNQTLDALKTLYNRLGSQISQARKDLDKALKISKVIAKHNSKVTSLIESTESRLQQDIQDLDEEVLWLEENNKKLEGVQTTLTAISTLYEQFQQYAEETALDEAKVNLESIKERYQTVTESLAARLQSVQMQRAQADADLEVFAARSQKLLHDISSVQSHINSYQDKQKLLDELKTLRGEMTNLCEKADELSAKGGNYKEKVVPVVDSMTAAFQQVTQSTQLDGESTTDAVAESAGLHSAESTYLKLTASLSASGTSKYTLASAFAQCEAVEGELPENCREEFQLLLTDWNSKRSSTVERWQKYEYSSALMFMKLGDLEKRLEMAQTQTDLLQEIEEEIARRQVDINALNEQAEELTECDTPSIEQHILELNQRWVGIRSKVANFTPASSPAPKTTMQLSPPTKQKYEYAVINKMKKESKIAVTPEILLDSPEIACETAVCVTVAAPLQNGVASADVDSLPADVSKSPEVAATRDSEESEEVVRTLISRVGILQQQLRNSGVEVDEYTHENFSSSQHLLQSVRISIDVLKEDIKSAESSIKVQNISSSALDDALGNLNDTWNTLNSDYSHLQRNFDEALTLWTQFHNLQKVITTWIEQTDKVLKRGRDKSGELIVSQAKLVQQELEDSMSEHQAILHNLARTAVPLASKLKPADAERITNKVSAVTTRWKEITAEIRSRKPRLDSMAESGKCLDVMDDLSFWLDETEVILMSSPDYTNELSLKDTLDRVKERREELPHKKEAVNFVARSAKDLWNLPGLKADDKEKLGRDMQRINRKWGMINKNIEDRIKYLESCIQNLEDLLFEIGKLNQELWDAIQEISSKLGEDNFTRIKSSYPRDQAITIETLNAWYREVLLLYKKHSAILPRSLEAHYRRLNIKWSALKERSQLNRADSDSSIEETLATAVDSDNIFEEPRHSVFLEDYKSVPRDNLQIDMSAAGAAATGLEACPLPPPRKESLLLDKQSQVLASDREETLSLLKERLAALNRTVSNRRVDLSNRAQISDSQVKVGKLTVAVQEILRQLSMFPEADNQVSGLRAECSDCQVKSLGRCKELKQMLIDSHKYGNDMAHVDSQLQVLEDKMSKMKKETLGDALDVVQKQMEQHCTLEADVKTWENDYTALTEFSSYLMTTYPNEDSSTLKLNTESLALRCNSLQRLLSQHSNALAAQKQILDNFDKTLNDFLLWVTEQESLADILLDEIQENHSMRSFTWTQRFKDLQSQIDSHHQTHELLNITGRRFITAENSESTETVQKLGEVNERWKSLRTTAVKIRSKLDLSMDQWSELISKCRQLLDFLMSRENELIAARPVAGSLPEVKQQQLSHEDWKNRLESKTSEFEHTITTGRFLLEKEGADRRLSSSSCDSKIIEELSLESSESKAAIKNIRRHIRLLNQKWVELHNKSERWQNQLTSTDRVLNDVTNLVNIAVTQLDDTESSLQSWSSVGDCPIADLPRQLTMAKALKRKNDETGEVLNKLNSLLKNQEYSEGPVATETTRIVSQLLIRQVKAEKSLNRRLSELEGMNSSLVPEMGVLLSDSVSRPYERATTPTGIPYFINHENKTTQWDHPRMVTLLAQLSKFNTTKFSAYRTAQKLRKVQQFLGLSSVALKDVIQTCKEHGVVTEHGEDIIEVNLMIECLRELFEHQADESGASDMSVSLSIDLSLNWLLNVYDLGRQGQIRTLSFQVGLVVMCKGAVEDKFNYLLSCLADESSMIDEQKLSLLLTDCIQIPRQLGELNSFGGSNVKPSVDSCLQQAKGQAAVSCSQFLEWLTLEPQSMVWLPVYHRLATSESCKHQAKCSLCKITPIVGLRYRCLRCFNFNLCQSCFFSGKKGKNHKVSHPMKEYYCSSTSGEEMKDMPSPMRKKYSSGRYIRKHNPKGYLPLNTQSYTDSTLSRESISLSSSPSINKNCDLNKSSCSENTEQSCGLDSPIVDDFDIHRDIEKYSSTLSRLEYQNSPNSQSDVRLEETLASDLEFSKSHQHNGNSQSNKPVNSNGLSHSPVPADSNAQTPSGNDEHQIIGRYCLSLNPKPVHKQLDMTYSETNLKSPMQIVMSLEDSQKAELEAMIKDLEDENRNLQSEYESLQAQRDIEPVSASIATEEKEVEMLAEANLLRQHKGRLEGRMKILEDHNKQLESQLHRLKCLLEKPSADPSSIDFIKCTTPMTGSSSSPLRVKRLPPTYERENSAHSTISGSIGELFQMAGQVGKAVEHLVSVVSTES